MRLAASGGEEAANAGDMMERQLRHLTRLVDELLDVSRISRGKIDLRRAPVVLGRLLEQAAETARPVCDEQQQALVVSLPPEPLHVNADATRLVQVFGNLLSNACKFSDAGRRVELTLARDPEASGKALIRVRDSGIGIAAEHLPRVFDLFMQVDASLERSVSGLGMASRSSRTWSRCTTARLRCRAPRSARAASSWSVCRSSTKPPLRRARRMRRAGREREPLPHPPATASSWSTTTTTRPNRWRFC